MEHAELSGHTEAVAPSDQLYSYLRQACTLYEVPTPSLDLTMVSDEDAGEYDPCTRAIRLNNSGGRNLLMLAHELAHHIVSVKWPKAADHGPTFVRTYAELLDLMRLVPIAGFRAICRRHKVRIASRV